MKLVFTIFLSTIFLATNLFAQIGGTSEQQPPFSFYFLYNISGQLIDSETGNPVSQVQIRITDSNGLPAHTSASINYSNGRFTATTRLLAGSPYSLEIDSSSHQYKLLSGTVASRENEWGTIELSKRPFYFENFQAQSNEVTASVINTTGRRAYMRFWLTGQLTRLDDSDYFGSEFTTLLQLKARRRGYKTIATYRLNPGENPIKLNIKDYGPNLAISDIQLNGGRSSLEPMMVAAPGPPITPPPRPFPEPPSLPPYSGSGGGVVGGGSGSISGGSIYIGDSSYMMSGSVTIPTTPPPVSP